MIKPTLEEEFPAIVSVWKQKKKIVLAIVAILILMLAFGFITKFTFSFRPDALGYLKVKFAVEKVTKNRVEDPDPFGQYYLPKKQLTYIKNKPGFRELEVILEVNYMEYESESLAAGAFEEELFHFNYYGKENFHTDKISFYHYNSETLMYYGYCDGKNFIEIRAEDDAIPDAYRVLKNLGIKVSEKIY